MNKHFRPSKGMIDAAKLLAEAIDGSYTAQGRVKALISGTYELSEALTTSDLAKSFIAGINMNVEQQYKAQDPTWSDFSRRLVLPDFKPQFLREILLDQNVGDATAGGYPTAVWSLPNVPELAEYPTFGYATSAKAMQTLKHGARLPFSWEAVINDEWHLLSSIPGKLLEYAKNTEDTSAYNVLTSATGPNSATFSTTNNNVNGSGNSAASNAGTIFNAEYPLTLDSLALAKRELQNRKYNNIPLAINSFRLIVPRAMADYARHILNIEKITTLRADDTLRAEGTITNSDVQLTVSDWLGRIDQSSTSATTWYLVPDGGYDGNRTTIAVAFLQNYETPEIRQSALTGQFLGGGDVPSLEGSMLNDDIEYRVRHVVNGVVLNPWGLLASKGNSTASIPVVYGA